MTAYLDVLDDLINSQVHLPQPPGTLAWLLNKGGGSSRPH